MICATLRGVYDVASTMVELENGSSVTPTEFERLAGKSSSKKWKASIRIERSGGRLGQTIGDWLDDQVTDSTEVAMLSYTSQGRRPSDRSEPGGGS